MAATETRTDAGLILQAQWVKGMPVKGISWIAIGSGSWIDKTNPPPVSASATMLTNEVARRAISRTAYLERDDVSGVHWWQGHKYKEVAGPTKIIACFAEFGPDDLVDVPICEEGVFAGDVDTLTSPLALPGEVITPGTLWWVRNRPAHQKIRGEVFVAKAIFEEK